MKDKKDKMDKKNRKRREDFPVYSWGAFGYWHM